MALVMVGDLSAAEDVVQDAFEQVHRRWHGVRDDGDGLAGVFAAGQAATSSRPGPGNATAAASLPPFYLTLSGKPGHAQAVVRDSRSGARLSSVPIPLASGAGFFSWIAAGNDRMYALAAPQGTAGEQFFLLRIAATGRTAKLTKLPIRPPRSDAAVTGIALSPDGEKLAVALETGSSPRTHGILEVASTRTGATRSWTEHSQYGFPFDPAWASHGRQLGFGWYNHIGTGRYPSSKAEVRLLDPAAPGHRLLAARVIVPEAKVPGAIQTALLTPDGHSVVASIYRATSSGHPLRPEHPRPVPALRQARRPPLHCLARHVHRSRPPCGGMVT